MAFSFTEKKRIRKDFGKLSRQWSFHTCWLYRSTLTTNFYRSVRTQGNAPSRACTPTESVFPIVSYSGSAALEYVDYQLKEPPST